MRSAALALAGASSSSAVASASAAGISGETSERLLERLGAGSNPRWPVGLGAFAEPLRTLRAERDSFADALVESPPLIVSVLVRPRCTAALVAGQRLVVLLEVGHAGEATAGEVVDDLIAAAAFGAVGLSATIGAVNVLTVSQVRHKDAQFDHLAFEVDGVDLQMLVGRTPVLRNTPGSMTGLPLKVGLLPSLHLFGQPDPEYSILDRPAIFVCGQCASMNCGAVTASIEVSRTNVRWRDFQEAYMDWTSGEWTEEPLPVDPLEFDRDAYEHALMA
jgi:hypothetical protein